MGYSRVQKGYRCYCPTLRCYFVSIDVALFKTTPFSLSFIVTSQGVKEDLLVYNLASPIVSPEPAPAHAKVKPPITQVYIRRQHPPVSSPPQVLRHQIQFSIMIFILLSVKVNVSVLIQFLHFALMTTCLHILVLLLHP